MRENLAKILPAMLLLSCSCSKKEQFATHSGTKASKENLESSSGGPVGERSAEQSVVDSKISDTASPASDSAGSSVDAQLGTAGRFLEPGKSLDLYLLLDRSGSMEAHDNHGILETGSDPTCKRFAALGGLLEGISPLVPELRLSLILFWNSSKHLVTLDTKINSKPNSFREWLESFREAICAADGATHILAATQTAIKLFKEHEAQGTRKDVTSLVLFTDGLPTRVAENQQFEVDVIEGVEVKHRFPTAKEMDQGVAELHAKFGATRVFGILLGDQPEKKSTACYMSLPTLIPAKDGCPPESPLQFMHKYTASPERTLLAKDADSLAPKMTELLTK